ncbi:MAG: LTA synthase family protein [Treponema sp.]|nr:LTA synthase family protein [Treponema sp.]
MEFELLTNIKIAIVFFTSKKERRIRFDILLRIITVIFALFTLVEGVLYVDSKVSVFGYIKHRFSKTSIYEEYYVSPESVKITAPENKKNLIHIYVESLETTYAHAKMTKESQNYYNFMPKLQKLAQENVSFWGGDTFGGFNCITGSGWTIASLFAQNTGVPFAFPVGNNMGTHSKFAEGICTLGDILEKEGYNQEFLCGSDGNFAGRKTFFEQHGNYTVFDVYTAREKGYIPEDYWVWWGFEDEILYKIAKDEITRLASLEKPFNFSFLTVDTHHVGGYKCSLCGNEYDENLANVVTCADNQLAEFINWLKNQPFYEDSVIVITGDHPRMDNILINGIPLDSRLIYNCFIGSNLKEVDIEKLHKRKISILDIFPTTLAAMDFKIEGNKLGLGTNAMSEETNLMDTLGLDLLNDELSKYSEYYFENFN